MIRKNLSPLAGLVLLFAGAASLQADSIFDYEMTVNVPFEFAVGDKVLAAGDYTVQINSERAMVVLRDEGHRPLIILATRKESQNAPERGKLVFRRYGTTFLLAEVWSRDNSIGEMLAPRAREKELARKKQPEQILAVQAR